MRSGEPAKLTLTPRARSASATASDGRTWPAVPPAAITHLSCDCEPVTATDVKEDPDGGEHDDDAGASIRHQGQRDPGQRREADNGGQVQRSLPADDRRDPDRERLAERVAAAQGDPQARPAECRVRGENERDADETELLADDREDHVRVRLREVEDLLDALAQADAEDPARPEPDHRLHGLEARTLSVVPRIDEAEDARPPVRLEPDREEHEPD